MERVFIYAFENEEIEISSQINELSMNNVMLLNKSRKVFSYIFFYYLRLGQFSNFMNDFQRYFGQLSWDERPSCRHLPAASWRKLLGKLTDSLDGMSCAFSICFFSELSKCGPRRERCRKFNRRQRLSHTKLLDQYANSTSFPS